LSETGRSADHPPISTATCFMNRPAPRLAATRH
jgi:hypothetical protein